jgi:hypothetical protein
MSTSEERGNVVAGLGFSRRLRVISMNKLALFGSGAAVALTLQTTAFAADPPPPAPPKVDVSLPPKLGNQSKEYVPDEADKKLPEGWSYRVAAGATGALSDNRQVVGQVSGGSFAFGFKADLGLNYNEGPHEWRNTLGLGAGVSKTPAIDAWIKSSDALTLESIYLYHVTPWFGFFARAGMQTSMFRGTDFRPAPVHYQIALVDGTLIDKTAAELVLSDPFQPMTLKQSIGPFVQPIRRKDVTVELRAGLGAQEIFAKDQLTLADNADTKDIIEVKQLASVNQLGAEVTAVAFGELVPSKVTYKVEADALTPFAHTSLGAADDRGALALTNVYFDAQLQFRLVDWASLDYEFKAVRQPQLIDAVQVQNNLLLSIGAQYSSPPPPAAK